MDKEGSKRVEIAGVDDKRQITAVFAGSLTGDFLPPQLIYKGTTHRCLPTVQFPSGWHITCSENHWSNESTMKAYIERILLPYVHHKRKELKLAADYPALVINARRMRTRGNYDSLFLISSQARELLKLLEDNSIYFVMVPANCTDRLQPTDVSVNKPAKNFLRQQFQEWYAEKICKQLDEQMECHQLICD